MRRDWFHASSWARWAWAIPFGQGARFFEAGEVRLAVLSLLAEAPRNGYQLIKELQERSGGLYRASAGSVYPTLQQLEDEGLAELKPEGGRRIYHITAAGRAELAKDPEAVRRIWERAERWEDLGQHFNPSTFALIGPAAMVMRSALHAAKCAGGNRDLEQKIIEVLDRARKELDELAASQPATREREAPRAGKPRKGSDDESSPWFL